MFTLYVKGYRNNSFTAPPADSNESFVDLDSRFASFDVSDGVTIHYNCLGQCKITCETKEQAEAVERFLEGYEIIAVNPDIKFVPHAQTPNDPLYANQWHHVNLDSSVGWDYMRQQGAYRIGVIDTGFMDIPDLNENRPYITILYKGNIYTNVVGAGCFSQSNNVEFYTSRSDDRNWKTSEGEVGLWSVHGSHVGGIIAAKGNNSKGVTGEIWNVYSSSAGIFPVKAFNYGLKYKTPYGTYYSTTGSFDAIYNAIDVCVAIGCKVVNMSIGAWVSALYGGKQIKELFEDKFEAAYNATGTVFVIAAGNSGMPIVSSDPFFGLPVWELPAACEPSTGNVITVTAAKRNNDIAVYSNYHMRLCDIAGYGGAGYDDVTDDILSTAGKTGLCEKGHKDRVVTIQGDNTEYMYLAGTSMAAPTVAGIATLCCAKYLSIKNTHINVDTLRRVLRGACKHHNRNHFFTNMAGGVVNLHYALMGVTEHANGYNPPALDVYIDEENDIGVLCIKVTNNDTATRNCIVHVGVERFFSFYDSRETEQPIADFSVSLNAGSSYVFTLPFEQIGDSYDKLLGITAYSWRIGGGGILCSYCNKVRYTIKSDCPSDLSTIPVVDVISVDPRPYFGGDIPDYREFDRLFDGNAVTRLYRYAHIVLTAAYGQNYPPSGGIVSLPDDVGVDPKKYVLRADVTQRDIMYALAMLHRQLYDAVNNGIYRYSSKFARGMWYYPIDTVAYYNGKLKRKRYSDTFYLDYCEIRMENMKRVVMQIYSMLRSLSCLFTVLYSLEKANCGASIYTARHWGLDVDSFISKAPYPIWGHNFLDTTTNSVKIDGVIRDYRCNGSNLESNTETPPRYQGITQNTAGGITLDQRVFPFHPANHYPYFFKTQGVTAGDIEYFYVSCASPEVYSMKNKTESDFVTGYTPPNENAWSLLNGYIPGVGHGDRSTPLNGSPTRVPAPIYNSLGSTGDGIYAHYGTFSTSALAESYRVVLYKDYQAIRVVSVPNTVLPPIRISVVASFSKLMPEANLDPIPLDEHANTNPDWPVKQTLVITGYYKIYKNSPTEQNLLYYKPFTYSLDGVPYGQQQIQRVVDVVTVDMPEESPGIIIIESALDRNFAKSQPVGTFFLHYTAKPVPAAGGDIRLVRDDSYVGKPYETVLAGVQGETFNTGATWNLTFYPQLMVPYQVGYYGHGSYTRECYIGVDFYAGTHIDKFVTVPDVRGMFKTSAATLLSNYGLNPIFRTEDRVNAVVFRRVEEDEPTVEPIVCEIMPPPGYIYNKDETPVSDRKVYIINQVGTTESKLEYQSQQKYNTHLFEMYIPSVDSVAYTIPHKTRPYKNVSQRNCWAKNMQVVPGFTEYFTQQLSDVPAGSEWAGIVYRKDKNGTDNFFTVVFPFERDIAFTGAYKLNDTVYNRKIIVCSYTDVRPDSRDFIPDLVGLKYTEAVSVANKLGVQLVICGGRSHFNNRGGSTYVVSQWPTAGTEYWPFFFYKHKRIYILLNINTPTLNYLDVDL